MREAFSYKTDRFFPLLLISLTVHFSILAVGKLLPSAARFAVVQAPHSVEVTLIEENISSPLIPQSIPKEPEQILPDAGDAIVLREEVQRPSQPADIQPDAVKNEPQGAKTAARPLYHINPAPSYPSIARRKGWEGTVFLRVFVKETGLAGEIAVERSSGYKILDETALETVRSWEFVPAKTGAAPFASWVTVPVQFTLVSE